MLKKLLMLPLMAFALVTLTAATVSEDGEDIFKWEIVSENAALPEEDPDENITFSEDNQGEDFETNIFNRKDELDVYISNSDDIEAALYFNFNDKYNDYSSSNQINLDIDYNPSLNEYIHIKITDFSAGDISVIGGGTSTSDMETRSSAPGLNELDNYYFEPPTVFEEIGGALTGIVTAGSSVFVSAFDGLLDVFWDADANDGDGALNWIAYIAVLPVGFYLVRWGIRQIMRIMQQRL